MSYERGKQERAEGDALNKIEKMRSFSCPRSDQVVEDQVYVSTVRLRSWKYHVYRCKCTGKSHYNRILANSFLKERGPKEQKGYVPGRSIFGQNLPRRSHW